MEWELWRHDGPNPGYMNATGQETWFENNNAYYLELTTPQQGDGICIQKLRVLAFENSYVRA